MTSKVHQAFLQLLLSNVNQANVKDEIFKS